MKIRTKIGIALRAYAFAATTSFFLLMTYHWLVNDVWTIWEPNPATHAVELAMMLAAAPGLTSAAWRISE